MSIFSSLRKDEKEAVGLLQIGTFLEYFDLMLYVHMAVLLNDLFFPKTDPHTAALLSALVFCSTWVFRPVGALIFGYIGDNFGRKTTVIITTMLMAISCVIMATLPTYAQIGLTATCMITACRIMQGMSSIGEITGAEIYLTELIKPPQRYPAVAFISAAAMFGGVAALCVASFAITTGFNWRIAFWIGAAIAMIGVVARTKLRETPDFVDMKRRMKKAVEEASHDGLAKAAELLVSLNTKHKEKIDKKTMAAYFALSCAWPVCFYFTYIYCAGVLKNEFSFSPVQIINQNLIIAIVGALNCTLFAVLSGKIHPLKLLMFKLLCFVPFALICPFIISNASSANDILLIQLVSILFALVDDPARSVLLIYFPVFKRFTYSSVLYALSRAFMYVITSFGMIYLTEYLGHKGLWLVMLPAAIGYFWSLQHFIKLEKKFHPEMYSKLKPQSQFPLGSIEEFMLRKRT